jgi:hypothetical protein
MKYIIFFLLLPVFANAQSSLLKYEWRKISGPANYTIASPYAAQTAVSNLETGIYQFELTVTNSNNISARDTMKVTVQAAANKLQTKFYQTEVVAFIRNNYNKAMVN